MGGGVLVFLYLAAPPHPQALPTTPASAPHEPFLESYASRRNPAPHRSTQAEKPGPSQRMDAATAMRPWSTMFSVTLNIVDQGRIEYTCTPTLNKCTLRAAHRRPVTVECAVGVTGCCFEGVPKATIRELSLGRRETTQLWLVVV
ncbi:hypothetical protein VC83_04667 [Pseudogymnoascus destructans]|uniref:Uncharacterized protein n=2 Tax=Pseudogymnoascus destructans TaxID=655981 RepID=L8G647_PSED2|nr:uncharacterized protein VC83_04667 [Pseudogymnoascus destructans]ELR08324.1 hypothetical protein GMDG_03119 [Pseudogymnoascus destructans 20631-21]OAF57266.1 hypothetical protein VC83_04667 [Pseudogymnoascus destructans]